MSNGNGEETIDDVVLDLLKKPRRVLADGQAVEMQSLRDSMDAADRIKASRCRGLRNYMIQKACSGPAYGA